jgi:hypothetical protein
MPPPKRDIHHAFVNPLFADKPVPSGSFVNSADFMQDGIEHHDVSQSEPTSRKKKQRSGTVTAVGSAQSDVPRRVRFMQFSDRNLKDEDDPAYLEVR